MLRTGGRLAQSCFTGALINSTAACERGLISQGNGLGWLKGMLVSRPSPPKPAVKNNAPDSSIRLPQRRLDDIAIVVLRLRDIERRKDRSDAEEYGGVGQDATWTDPVVENRKSARSPFILWGRHVVDREVVEAIQERDSPASKAEASLARIGLRIGPQEPLGDEFGRVGVNARIVEHKPGGSSLVWGSGEGRFNGGGRTRYSA